MGYTVLLCFALFQLFNAFNCRKLHSTNIFRHLLKNKLMLVVVGCTFALQILIIQFAGAFFGTTALDLVMWVKLFGVAAVSLFCSNWRS
jgi:Ca2+-transporting ATPase